MSDVVETKPSRLPMPIREMAPWSFWASPDAIGLSADDAAAIADNTATPEQVQRAELHSRAAMEYLIRVPCGDVTVRPS